MSCLQRPTVFWGSRVVSGAKELTPRFPSDVLCPWGQVG